MIHTDGKPTIACRTITPERERDAVELLAWSRSIDSNPVTFEQWQTEHEQEEREAA